MWGNMARANTGTMTRAVVDDTTIELDCAKEMESYLMSEGLAIKDSKGVYVDPLQWWAKNEKVYPVLARLAKDFLAIPATSA